MLSLPCFAELSDDEVEQTAAAVRKACERPVTTTAEALKQRLAGEPIVGLIGLGYVGLPLAVAFAESGATVIGVDLDARRVAAVRRGRRASSRTCPRSSSPGRVRAGRLSASVDIGRWKDADAIVICVPTPLGKSKEPDISFIVGARRRRGRR
mgnify:CR=1 FL=1